MSAFLLTPEARADLFSIWEYIAEENLDAADSVIATIEKTFHALADTPGVGHYRDDLLDRRYRFHNVYSYVIAYRYETVPIQIIAIVHGARNLEAFFSGKQLH